MFPGIQDVTHDVIDHYLQIIELGAQLCHVSVTKMVMPFTRVIFRLAYVNVLYNVASKYKIFFPHTSAHQYIVATPCLKNVDDILHIYIYNIYIYIYIYIRFEIIAIW